MKALLKAGVDVNLKNAKRKSVREMRQGYEAVIWAVSETGLHEDQKRRGGYRRFGMQMFFVL